MYISLEYFEYLDELRASGVTNMYAAGPYLRADFGLSRAESHEVLAAWMKTFSLEKSAQKRLEEYEAKP